MADERIDIEIQDKVAKSIRPEILGIGEAAKNAYLQIAKLKRELGVTGSSGMAASVKAVASAERDASRAGRERARQADATARALDREAAAQARLAAVAARAARTSVPRGVGSSLGGSGGSRSVVAEQTRVMREMSVVQDTVARTTEKATKAQNTFANSVGNSGKQAGVARHHMLNLGFQLQDIFVSLASGQKPLTVFIQQGGQIGQIAAQSGVGLGGMAKAIGGILLRFAPLTIGLTAAAAGFALFNRAMTKDIDTKKIIDGLGLTRKEIKKLENATITSGDVITATFQVMGKEIVDAMGISMAGVQKLFTSAMDNITHYAKVTMAGIVALFRGTRAYLAELEKGGISGIVTGSSLNGILEKTYGKEYDDYYKYLGEVGKKIRDRLAKNFKDRMDAQAKEIKLDRTPKKAGKSEAERQAEALRKLMDDLNREQATLERNLVGIDASIAQRMDSIADSLNNDKIDLASDKFKDLKKQLEDTVTEIEKAKLVSSPLTNIYGELIAPTEQWEAAQEAAAIALKKYGDANEQAGIHRWLALQKEAFLDLTNPLRQHEKAIKDQIELQKYYGRELQIQTEIQRRYNEQLALQPNITPDRNKIGNDVRSDIAVDERNSALGSVEGSMAAEQIRMLQLQIDAYKELGGASLEASNAIRDLRIQQNQLAVEAGTATWQTTFVTGMSKVVEGFKGVKAGVMDLTATMMGSFVDGVSNSIGRAIVMGDSLRDSLKQVGQTILTELISGLVKLAIQFGINQLVSATLGSAALATTAVQATAAATMWAPAAALASLATLGANAAPAAAAIIGTTALTSALAMFSGAGFQKGGYTGDMPAHAPVGTVHGREYVMDAATTARIGVPALDALRSGRLNPGPANDNKGLNVKIINNGNDDVKVQELSDGELMVIIDKRLDAKFDRTMQQKLSNPNSGSSKAISSNFKTVRNRN